MKINRLVFSGLKSFRFRNDARLEVDYISGTQTVLGTNGAGKSRYLSQLLPYPPVSSTYTAEGYREHHIEHDGKCLEIVTDFSRKDGNHRFYITDENNDRVNFNESGTTRVQEELVNRYLGLTPEKVHLLFGEISFTSMTAGQRETLLTKLAPMKLYFMYEHQKKVAKAIRALKSELNYLSTREMELTSRIMTEEERRGMVERRDWLNADILKKIGERGAINEGLRAVLEELGALPHANSPEVVAERIAITEGILATLAGVSGDVAVETALIDHLRKRMADSRSEQETLWTQIRETESTLQKSDASQIDIKEAEIQGWQNRIAECGPLPSQPKSAEEIQDLRQALPKVQSVCHELETGQTKLIKRSEYNEMREVHERERTQLYSLTVVRERLEQQIAELDQQLSRGSDMSNIDPCAKERCPLYNYAVGLRTDRQTNRDNLAAQLETTVQAINVLNESITPRGEQLALLAQPMAALDKLGKLVGMHGALHPYMTDKILSILSTNPMHLAGLIGEDIKRAHTAVQVAEYQEKIKTLQAEIAAVATIGKDYRQLLENDLAIKLAKAEEMRVESESITTQIEAKTKVLSDLHRRDAATADLQTLQVELGVAYKRQQAQSKLADLTGRSTALQQALDAHTSEMGGIDNSLTEQNRLIAQYEGEVKRRKKEVEQAVVEQTQIEEALKAIPEAETRKWIASLIESVNYYLSMVWSHRLEVEFNDDSPLDYKFPKWVLDERTDNISLSSKGEKKMIDLAFCLALRDSLDMRDYPLFLDEMGDGFDTAHLQKLVNLFRIMVDKKLATQVVLIIHQASLVSGLTNVQTFVVDDTNIVVPEVYNEGIIIS